MENKEKLLEEIKQAEQHLINLKEALNKPDTVEVAADGAILVEKIGGVFIGGSGHIYPTCFAENFEIKYLSRFISKEHK